MNDLTPLFASLLGPIWDLLGLSLEADPSSVVQRGPALHSRHPGKTPGRSLPRLSDSGEPSGWLGYIVQHGNLTQMYQMRYLSSRCDSDRPHIMPHWRLNETKKNVGLTMSSDGKMNAAISSPNGINKGAADNFTEMFVEWPSPAWFSFRSQWYRLQPGLESGAWNKYLYPRHLVLSGLAEHAGSKNGDNLRTAQSTIGGSSDPWFEHGSRSWQMGISDYLAQTMTWNPEPLTGEPYHLQGLAGKVSVPAYWQSHVDLFYARLRQFYGVSQWMVWAGEMMRIHAKVLPGPAWRNHCLAWGIGCASPARMAARVNMADHGDFQIARPVSGSRGPGRMFGSFEVFNPLSVKLSDSQVNEYLNLIIKHSPPPGTSGQTGQQIIDGPGRAMFDIPAKMGSFLPPYDIEQGTWKKSMLARYEQHVWNSWASKFVAITGAVMSAAGALAGGVGGAAGGVAGSVANGVITGIIQLGSRLTFKTGDLDWGDVVGAAGKVLSSVSAPEGLADLQAIGDKVAGTPLAENFNLLLDTFDDIAKISHWPYLNEALGTLQDSSKHDLLKEMI